MPTPLATRYEVTRDELADLLDGEPRYRLDQVWAGLYTHLADPADITNLPKKLRQRLDDLVASVLEDRPDIEQMCAACFSGIYPTGDITPEMLLQIEEERTLQGK